MINSATLKTQHVLQGQWHLTNDPNEILTTILGSCIAACIFDPILKVGGMNHFLLPGKDPRDDGNVRYGAQSMEELINALLRKGADRKRLEVWLFGGASVLANGARPGTSIGASNAAFAQDFVRMEGFKLRGTDLGGTRGRRIKFHPFSGASKVALVQETPTEQPVKAKAPVPDIELF